MHTIVRHVLLETLGTFFKDRAFFNRVMACVALAQAIRLWGPDEAFNSPGYEWLHEHISENLYALLPFAYFLGVMLRAYTRDLFIGRVWFWRVNQATNAVGAIHFSVPAVAISYSLHQAPGMQSTGYVVIAIFMMLQIFVTTD